MCWFFFVILVKRTIKNIAPVQGFVPLTEQISNSYQIFYLPRVEKKNDDIRCFFHRKINRWDASTSVLLVEKCQEDLGGYERQPRKYMKKMKLSGAMVANNK